MNQKKIKVLLEMRPALEGFAGIPQEVRLLFRGLRKVDSIDIEGMIQSPHRTLAKGLPNKTFFPLKITQAKKMNRYSRVIISLAEKPYRNLLEEILEYINRKVSSFTLLAKIYSGASRVKLTKFESVSFEDFTWRTLFSKTLPASDFDVVATANHRICSVSWKTMHQAGLNSLSISDTAKYATLDTSGFDVFIGQTPYPARVMPETKMVIRYHDALPVLMPHTIPEKSIHQATHFHGLASNIKSGAWFACVSNATRDDLLKIFPEVSDRAVTIYNMVSHHYFKEDVPFERVPGIVRARLNTNAEGLVPKFLTLREQENFYKKNLPATQFKYLLIVSTVEPRKNHNRLLAAWEVLKAEIDPDIKLIIVGALGWDCDPMVKGFRPWIDRGQIFMLTSVPAPDLRVLYRHAAATVCPSLGEGFDFSGVESMASGGVTVASDIPVHREVYDHAAEYFDPYSTMSLVNVLKKLLYEDTAATLKEKMQKASSEVAARYTPDVILPQWNAFLEKITSDNKG